MFAAVAETLKLRITPRPPKIASGFHGGGGANKKNGEETEWVPTGCMCGALAAGVLILGVMYGRTSPKGPRYGCISQLSSYLHKRFQEELGGKCCALLRPFYQKKDREGSCQYLYQKGAELAVEVALNAAALVPECRKFRGIKKILNRSYSRKGGKKG